MLKPLPHQISGSEYLVANNGGLILSEPRTGKTLLVLRAIAGAEKFPALIICPNSVKSSWFGALIEDGVSHEDILCIDSMDRIQSSLLQYKYVICNYEKIVKSNILNLRKGLSRILGTDWKAIVLDESYKIASFNNKLSRHIMEDLPHDESQMRICMTGTPITESPLDIVQSYIFVNGEFFGYANPFAYRNAYYRENEYTHKWIAKSRIHESKVKDFVKSTSFQVKLSDLGLGGVVLKGFDLLEMSEEQKHLYHWLSVTSVYPKGDEICELYAPVRVMFYQKVSSGIHPFTNKIISLSKADLIAEKFKESKHKALVLSRFTTVIPAIVERLKSFGIRCESIVGATPIAEREVIRRRFQDGDLDMVVAQVDTVARGLDFSSLDRIYYYTNTYSMETRLQSELRGQNVKRTTPYEVIDLCYDGSIDTEIRDVLIEKNRNVQEYIAIIDSTLIAKWRNQ